MTRFALLIFVVPLGLAAGRPLELLARSIGPSGRARLEALQGSRAVKIFGNAMFATVFVALLFFVFLTPLSATIRESIAAENGVDIGIPLLGLLLVLPIATMSVVHTTVFLAIEFLLTFAELLIDAIPGLLLRLNDHVLDGAATISNSAPWWPSALRDQQLAGDSLWFIAEFADLPILILLLVRWVRSDRVDAHSVDELSDEEYAEVTEAYLRGELNTSMLKDRSPDATASPQTP